MLVIIEVEKADVKQWHCIWVKNSFMLFLKDNIVIQDRREQ